MKFNGLFDSISVSRAEQSIAGSSFSAMRLGQRALACALMYLMIPLGVSDVLAQDVPPPPPPDQSSAPADQGGAPPQNYNALSPDQLDQLVAPIALYPDSLVAQILAASTFPTQVVDADRFVQSHQGVPPDQLGQMANSMQWDPSVKALVAFPSVLANLDKNLDWTSQLGNAYYNQPQDVMSAVQSMRQRAYQSGNLKSSEQLAVTYQPNEIAIVPANPAVVYVPYYNPWVIYGGPVVAWPGYYVSAPPFGVALGVGLAIGFGVGISIGLWNHWGWGWHNWGVGWRSHAVVFQRNVYVSRSVTVVNHGYYGRFDRNPAARSFNRSMAMRAPDYRGAAFNHGGNFSHAANGSFNHSGTSNFNRPGGNSFNRPAGSNSFNRPGMSNSFSHTGSSNVSRPGTTSNFNRTAPSGNRTAPQNHAAPQGHSGGSRPSGGGHPSSHSNHHEK